MKNLRHLLTAFLLVCCTVAMAEIVTIGGITYDVIVKAKQASVFAKETGEYSGSVVIPETIVYNDVTYSVTTIGESTFAYCDGLTSVTIPNSVTSIGKEAFSNCGLTSITIPNSVTTIGNRAFYDCGIKEVHISDLAAWCNISFEGSTANPLFYAQNLYLNGELVTDLVIPNSVTTIGNRAFYNYYGLTSITIPNSVTTIGDEAFFKCYRLTSITIPNSVTTIGNAAFAYCSGLTGITIPNSVTTIGNRAFMECYGLTSVTIPNSVTSIGSYAFSDCSGLTSVTIGSGVEYIYSYAFAICENLVDIYCLATIVPLTYSDAFNESYPEYMTLHVPAEAINSYKIKAPWSSFGNIVAINGGSTPTPTPTPKCANPVISYRNGELFFDCQTYGAEFVTKITDSDIDTFYSKSVTLSAIYNISVYATANGYDNSNTVNATLCWIENGESDNTNNIINVPAVAVLVTSANGVVTVSCSLEGETVAVYTTDGTLVGSAVITNGSTTIQSGLSKGSVAIVKIGNKSVKVVVD